MIVKVKGILLRLIFIYFLCFPVLQSCMSGKSGNTLAYHELLKSNYTQEEIELFNDIAFNNGRLHKWRTDLKVQVIGEASPNCISIDSVIEILAPLIAPLKIEKVKRLGNVIIYRDVDNKKLKGYRGYATLKSSPSKGIKSAVIYETKTAKYNTLLHEFEHVLGLSHPRKSYPYDLLIWGEGSPEKPVKSYHIESAAPKTPEAGKYYFKTWDEFNLFQDTQKRELLSEREKEIIRMLYLPQLKPGLKRSDFMSEMGIDDDLEIWE